MPIVEKDPWRAQYFENVPCPKDLFIPTDDELAWQLYPQYRWIYNKMSICESQDLEYAPHDILPPSFPVFSKPIYNLRGMGSGSKIIESAEQYEREQAPGHMWMPLLEGEHVSTDVIVVKGEPKWWRHTIGKALEGGIFDYWTILAEPRPVIEDYCGQWLRQHLKDYTGALNLETIGGKIIEAHLRFADQWPDLYGPGWLDAIVELYTHHRWHYRDEQRRTGYSVVLFGAHGLHYPQLNHKTVDEILTEPGISSLQITFLPDKPPEVHAMPPGGFRLAIVNCWDLEAGLAARERLALAFWSTQEIRADRISIEQL
ncbi:hypothetical protein [Nitrosococcus wardiae]|uniref:Uncharacterized protein n=1 Tax=Nitrosococcus wardiae TaxID=1814290 RepID=A0A4P7BWK8_9GAMM|nr:hypothetical protein [Nitrosococcus wardiae]QBQ53480.1 hypothetical protein E3U44_02415 [Nitrosococcus wardiae]